LKPGNVMLTKSGVKLLDFGLAKIAASSEPASELSSLPTQASRPLTQKGTVMGTFQYMAPEQLEGKDADARTDIFALGCVLYEMATGKRAFTGATQASLVSSILRDEPKPISAVTPLAPAALDRLVKSCLAKDPEDRWQSARDVRNELQWIGQSGSQASAPAAAVPRRRNRERVLAGALAAAIAAALLLGVAWMRRAPSPGPVLRSTISLPANTSLDPLNTALVLSPDGSRLAVAAAGADGKARLWLRSLDGLDVQPLPGTEGATCPFWSPDSRFIGFFADRKLKKVAASGAAVQTICDAPDARGGTWNAEDVIVFAPTPFGGLFRVFASGGTPVELTRVKEPGATHRVPSFLPDGRHVLFLSGMPNADRKGNGIFLLDITTKKTTLFAREDSEGRYAKPGYLLFVREQNLMAQPMDAARLKTTGEPVPIAEDVHYVSLRWSGDFSVADNGLLVFEPASAGRKRQLTWFDSDGRTLGTVGEPATFTNVVLAPDGRRAAAVLIGAGTLSIWTYDLARGVGNPFRGLKGDTYNPIWSPDGRLLAFAGDDKVGAGILVAPSDGSSKEKTVVGGLANPFPAAWSPDGRYIAYSVQDLKTGVVDLWLARTDGTEKPRKFAGISTSPGTTVAGAAHGLEIRFSPDGKWIAYVSDESGRLELYATPFPGAGAKRQISVDGVVPYSVFWVEDGRRILYEQPPDRKLIAVDIALRADSLEVGASHVLFGGRPMPEGPIAVTPDGKRILVAAPIEGSASPQVTLVTNWAAGIAKR
jgi:eukaryotic-like serine/threonine-protein kinase